MDTDSESCMEADSNFSGEQLHTESETDTNGYQSKTTKERKPSKINLDLQPKNHQQNNKN